MSLPDGWSACRHHATEHKSKHRDIDLEFCDDHSLAIEIEERWAGQSAKAVCFVPLPVLRALLASRGLIIEKECPEHGRACWDARCDVRDAK